MTQQDPVHWIDDPEALADLGRRLASADVISVDTEQDSFFSHSTKVCIIQVGAFGREWIIDALALKDFAPLSGPFGDQAIPKILHAGDNDIDLLRRNCGLEIRGLFDTMAAASILGHRRTGLAGLLEALFGVVIEKKYQRSDWRKRPLELEQIEYAALDVRHLPRLREVLAAEIEERGRLEEARAEFRRIERVVHEPKVFDRDDYYRIDGARSLDGIGRRALRDLFVLREKIAAAEDRAVFRVCGDRTLLDLARLAPARARDLERVQGLSERMRRRHGKALLALFARARSAGPLPAPRPRRAANAGVFQLDGAQRALYDRLRRWRSRRARQRDVEPGRVIPNALLLKIVLTRPETEQGLVEAGLEAWRAREYGADLLAVLGGRED
ncbi:MAG: ribonuclease D [Planctomycetes bacterium]|nr:ribonuclease D [Planctomycetota bacterium]